MKVVDIDLGKHLLEHFQYLFIIQLCRDNCLLDNCLFFWRALYGCMVFQWVAR